MVTEAPTKPPPKNNQKTWLDWQHESLPELPDPATEALLSREEFLDELRRRGIDLPEVTLTHWEKAGLLPRAIRRWQGAPKSFYPWWMLNVVAELKRMHDRDMSLAEIRPRMRPTILMNVVNSVAWANPLDKPTQETRPSLEAYVRAWEQTGGERVGGVSVQLLRDNGDPIPGAGFEFGIARDGDGVP